MKILSFPLSPPSPGSRQAFSLIKKGVVAYLFLFCCIAGCAHYPINPPLTKFDPRSGYRFGTLPPNSRSEELFVILAFSGGGTRAACLSYGVLEELARTEFEINGTKRRLLDEIDIISSVSGGSFTSAYYGLFGDRIFEDFEGAFLKRNIQGNLIGRLLNPWHWPRFWSPGYNRDDMAAELYDKYLFKGKTFGDLLQRPEAPYLIINATDVTSGFRFEFTQDQFDLIYSDLSSFPVSRAVTASSAVPGLFGTVRLNNQSKKAEDLHLKWVEEVLDDPESPLRLIKEAEEAQDYQNAKKRKYIHLVDGGVADNLGLRAFMDMISKQEIASNRAQSHLSKSIQKVLIIVVDSHVEHERGFSHKESLGLFSLIGASVGIPINRFSFETIELCERVLEERIAEIRKVRAREAKLEADGKAGMATPGPHLHSVILQFNNLPDKKDTEFFRSMPTSFKLKGEDVDRLREIAARQLRNSSTFQSLLRDLNAQRRPENEQ